MYRVFIVDDEPFIAEGLYDIIDWATLGLEIVGHAENGQEALEAMKRTPVDILITDISMPVMNGLELIRAAREYHPELKTIVLSGFDEFSYLKEGMRLGIENYLLKPINVEELRATLNNTVEKLHAYEEERMMTDYSTQILLDNTLHRWLTNQIGDAEFKERAELLGVDFDRSYIVAAAVRPEEPHGEMFERLSKELERGGRAELFRDIDGDIIVLCATDDEKEGMEAFRESLRRLHERLTGCGPFRTAIGSVEPLPDGAGRSYANAKRTQDYFWIYPDRELMAYGELPIRRELGRIDFVPNWPAYAKALVAKDKDALHELIQDDFSRLKELPGILPQDIQNMALELAVRLKVELKAIRHTEDPEMFHRTYERIRTAGGIVEAADALLELASGAIDSLVSDIKSPVVQQVLAYIYKHYAEELSLKLLGRQYNVHPVYLGQLFHKETGETFADFINKYRIDKAKEMLRTTQLKVHEIARQVGYWESGYFYKQFKKYVGVSPTEFKGLL